jgi:hypothetical protein
MGNTKNADSIRAGQEELSIYKTCNRCILMITDSSEYTNLINSLKEEALSSKYAWERNENLMLLEVLSMLENLAMQDLE